MSLNDRAGEDRKGLVFAASRRDSLYLTLSLYCCVLRGSVCTAPYSGVRCETGCTTCAGIVTFASASGYLVVSEAASTFTVTLNRSTGRLHATW